MNLLITKLVAIKSCCAMVMIDANSSFAAVQELAHADSIEEIQVTATRRPVSTAAVSAALTLIPKGDIESAFLATDALAMQPGIYLQQTTPGQGAAIVRGLKGSEVLHLVDGFRLNNAIFRNAPTQYLALVAPGTLERIEVIRGASGSLYGSDAVGGVVQAISRMPQFDERGSRQAATIALATADIARTVRASAEFGDRQLATLISGEYTKTGNRRIGKGPRIGPSGYRSKGARVAVIAAPDRDRRWQFDVQVASQPMTPRTDELTIGFGQTEPSSSEFWFAPNERLFGRARHVRNNWLWGASWSFDVGYQKIVDDRISRGYQATTRRHESNSSDLFGIGVNAAGEVTQGSWIIGAEIYHDRVSSERIEEDLTTGQFSTADPRFPDGSTMDQAAVFGSILRHVSDRNTLSAGIRFSAVDTELAAVPTASKSSQNDVSADFGWTVDLTDDTQVSANVGHGFRAPNIFDLGTLGERPGNRFNIPNPNLKSERVTQLDAGIRHNSDVVAIDLVLFALRYDDRIASVLTGNTTADGRDVSQSRNIAEANIRGLEFSARWQLRSKLRAEVVVNYLRGNQTDASGIDVPGDRIPPLNGRIAFNYQWNHSFEIEPYLHFSDNQDRLSPRDVNDNRINPLGTAGWLTANVAATWRVNDTFNTVLRIDNLLDRNYRMHGSGIDAIGRNLYLSVQANWN